MFASCGRMGLFSRGGRVNEARVVGVTAVVVTVVGGLVVTVMGAVVVAK